MRSPHVSVEHTKLMRPKMQLLIGDRAMLWKDTEKVAVRAGCRCNPQQNTLSGAGRW